VGIKEADDGIWLEAAIGALKFLTDMSLFIDESFDHNGRTYGSLSAIAHHATGTPLEWL